MSQGAAQRLSDPRRRARLRRVEGPKLLAEATVPAPTSTTASGRERWVSFFSGGPPPKNKNDGWVFYCGLFTSRFLGSGKNKSCFLVGNGPKVDKRTTFCDAKHKCSSLSPMKGNPFWLISLHGACPMSNSNPKDPRNQPSITIQGYQGPPSPQQKERTKRKRKRRTKGTVKAKYCKTNRSWRLKHVVLCCKVCDFPSYPTLNVKGSYGRRLFANTAGSKMCTENGTLVRGNMDQNLRNPSSLILSHTHTKSTQQTAKASRAGKLCPLGCRHRRPE